MQEYRFKISCIMAVYNVEKYIRDAIESILNQNIGFKKNVQLLLVNDGSTDNSGAICDEYKRKYPDNIEVIHKINEGVTTAKNTGLGLAEGEFVTFVDPDDMLGKGTMKEVYGFFCGVKDKTDVVAVPLYYFEQKWGGHQLNYKFGNSNRVVNLLEEPDVILLSSASAYYKLETAKKHRFYNELVVSEDFRFNYEIFLKNPMVGLVPEGHYLYRRRENNSSLTKTRWERKETYIPYMEYVHIYLIDLYKKEYGNVPKFLQCAMLYEIESLLKKEDLEEAPLSIEEKNIYINLVKQVIKEIELGTILNKKNLQKKYRLFLLEIKATQENYDNKIEQKYLDALLEEYRKYSILVTSIRLKEGKIQVSLAVDTPKILGKKEIKMKVAGEEKEEQIKKSTSAQKQKGATSLGESLFLSTGYSFEVLTNKFVSIEVIEKIDEKEITRILEFDIIKKNYEKQKGHQIIVGNSVVKIINNRQLIIEEANKLKKMNIKTKFFLKRVKNKINKYINKKKNQRFLGSAIGKNDWQR